MKVVTSREFIFGVILAGITTCSLGQSYDDNWDEIFAISEQMEKSSRGKEYIESSLRVHSGHFSDAMKCNDQAKLSGKTYFYAVIEIDAEGRATSFKPMPPLDSFDCFVKAFEGKIYPKPPISPFYLNFFNVIDTSISAEIRAQGNLDNFPPQKR